VTTNFHSSGWYYSQGRKCWRFTVNESQSPGWPDWRTAKEGYIELAQDDEAMMVQELTPAVLDFPNFDFLISALLKANVKIRHWRSYVA
jgi:hypothetical protein